MTTKLTPTEAKFLAKAISVAYDTADVREIFEDDFDRDVMDSAIDKLDETAKGHDKP